MEPITNTDTAANPGFRKSITAHKGYGNFAPPRAAAIMPVYVRERVSALKIADVVDSVKQNDGTLGIAPETPTPAEGSKYLTFEKNGHDPVNVDKEYMDTFNPVAGGYFTVDPVSGNLGYIAGDEFEQKFTAI